MFRINVAGASLNQIPRDWAGNTERILEAIAEAQKLGVSALCLPELAITGYSLEDEFFCPDVAIRAAKELKKIAAATAAQPCIGCANCWHRSSSRRRVGDRCLAGAVRAHAVVRT